MEAVITTFTGKRVNPLNLREEDICVEDIAHALSLCNRFAGHTKFPISVAQHSIFVSELCIDIDNENDNVTGYGKQALLHDASEAYLGDMTKWLKHTPAMEAFREAEDRMQRVIYKRFGCDPFMYEEVVQADKFMVRWEAHHGYGPDFEFPHPAYTPLSKAELTRLPTWEPWGWKHAEHEFLYMVKILGIK